MTRLINNILQLAPLSFVFVVFAGEPAVAQTNSLPDPEWLSVTWLRIKPEMNRDWLSLQKNETIPALQKGGLKWRQVWETAYLGEVFLYWIVVPIDSLAQMDDTHPIDKARVKSLGKEGDRALRRKSNKFTLGLTTYGNLTRPDLSYYGEMTGQPKLAVVNIFHVAPGRTMEFENLLKKEALPVMKQARISGYWVEQSIYGGDSNAYFSFVLYDSFAEIGKGSPFIRVLGKEGANKIDEKFAGIVSHTERYILRYNSDLSFSGSHQLKQR